MTEVNPRPRCRTPSPTSCATTTCPRRCAWATTCVLAMPWGETALEISHGPSVGDDLNAVSHAFGAVAETGTLALISGSESFDAQLPSGQPLHRRRRPKISPAVYESGLDGFDSHSVRAACRARSTGSPGRRAPATSSRPCCSAPMVRGGCM